MEYPNMYEKAITFACCLGSCRERRLLFTRSFLELILLHYFKYLEGIMIVVREAVSADKEALQDLIKGWIATQTLFPKPKENVDFKVLDDLGSGKSASLFFCVVAQNKETGSLVGYALCTYNYAIWIGRSVFLENIYVKENYRLNGIGTKLMAAICQHALEKQCRQINYIAGKDDNSTGFFEKMGGTDITKEGWLMYTLPQENIK